MQGPTRERGACVPRNASLRHEIAESCDGPHADPRHRALADIEHVGDGRLILAFEQQLHDESLAGREVWDRIVQSQAEFCLRLHLVRGCVWGGCAFLQTARHPRVEE